MLQVRTMSAEDFHFATHLANTMNWNMSEEDFKFMTSLEPQGCFVLFQGSERLGIATSISFGNVGWFGNLIVEEEHRKSGAGSLLVNHAVNFLHGIGVETIGLYAYPHLKGFYGKLGFREDVDFSVLSNENTFFTSTAMLDKAELKDFSALIRFDGEYFGANRQKLLNVILTGSGNLCYLLREGDGIKGYVAAKVYEGMAEIGPLICPNDNPQDAKLLLEVVLSKMQGTYVSLCMPKKQTTLIDWLRKVGFREDFVLSRMFLGVSAFRECMYVAESVERG